MKINIPLREIANNLTITELQDLIFLRLHNSNLSIEEFTAELSSKKTIYDYTRITESNRFIEYILDLYHDRVPIKYDNELIIQWNKILKELNLCKCNNKWSLTGELRDVITSTMYISNSGEASYNHGEIRDVIFYKKFPDLL